MPSLQSRWREQVTLVEQIPAPHRALRREILSADEVLHILETPTRLAL